MTGEGPLLVLAAGGTGGHMFPAQALAEEMLDRGWRVGLSTDARGARYCKGFPAEVEVRQVRSATPAGLGPAGRALVPLRVGGGTLGAMRHMRRARPAAVVGFGGYPSIPALAAAFALRLPRMIHEQNGILGRVNQAFARRVQRVACGTWPTALPAGVRGVHVGNPVRAAVRARAGAPYLSPGTGKIRLVAFGGSQGARVVSEVVPEALARLPEALRARLEVSHQARTEDAPSVHPLYIRAGIHAEIAPFFEDMPERLEAAQLVICRSGASTVADLSVIGRPSILIPFAGAIRDEQTANAAGLVDAGAAVLMPEAELAPEALAAQVGAILGDPERAARMARAALSQGRPDAARALADLTERLIEEAR